MNTEFISYCIKSVKRRWKSIFKTALSVFLAFSFVAGIMLFKTNMYEYQIQSAKHKFGSWIVMLYDSNLEENKELKNHPYLNESGKASVDNYVFENDNQTDIKVGYMDDDFIRIGSISLQSGSMPQNDDEAAIELDTLLKLNQGTQLGQEIHINLCPVHEGQPSGLRPRHRRDQRRKSEYLHADCPLPERPALYPADLLCVAFRTQGLHARKSGRLSCPALYHRQRGLRRFAFYREG